MDYQPIRRQGTKLEPGTAKVTNSYVQLAPDLAMSIGDRADWVRVEDGRLALLDGGLPGKKGLKVQDGGRVTVSKYVDIEPGIYTVEPVDVDTEDGTQVGYAFDDTSD